MENKISQEYIEFNESIDKFKVILPKANGSGVFGERLSSPFVGLRGSVHTQTYISFGPLNSEIEANNLVKYLCSKLSRALLGSIKVTQDNATKRVWANVPLQDFTSNSDIDWSKSIPEIDQQLYSKYGLSEEEIQFIEENVQPME